MIESYNVCMCVRARFVSKFNWNQSTAYHNVFVCVRRTKRPLKYNYSSTHYIHNVLWHSIFFPHECASRLNIYIYISLNYSGLIRKDVIHRFVEVKMNIHFVDAPLFFSFQITKAVKQQMFPHRNITSFVPIEEMTYDFEHVNRVRV